MLRKDSSLPNYDVSGDDGLSYLTFNFPINFCFSFDISTKFSLDDSINLCMGFVIKSTSFQMHSVAIVIALMKSSRKPSTAGSHLHK